MLISVFNKQVGVPSKVYKEDDKNCQENVHMWLVKPAKNHIICGQWPAQVI